MSEQKCAECFYGPATGDLIAPCKQHRVGQDVPLREAAAWLAEGLAYPIDFSIEPNCPMPHALWSALVDHVHADKSGKWHGNALDREDTESWLADEAGRDIHAPATPAEPT
ncbi:MAG: hypothetical protein CMJ18_07830 [Phycisphaeraceae bacterium]|nr:hypothetical protein [Phycisphaeraceae bacterium]